jgi:hypothetical protein
MGGMLSGMSTGAADTDQSHADNGHAPTPAPSQPRREAKVQLLVDPGTHREVRQLATRLGRSNNAVIKRAIRLLDRETAGERVKSDDEWADEAAS